MEEVILVDKNNNVIGFMEKMEAHKKGLLHRAFSIFLFNSKHQLLLQRRALNKYHSAGLWTNTCCSHPRKDESFVVAANRRLKEEMGLTCKLNYAFEFIYKAKLDRNLTEHELDHVFLGKSDKAPVINKEEAMNFKYISLEKLKIEIQNNPESYTEWLKICLSNVCDYISNNNYFVR